MSDYWYNFATDQTLSDGENAVRRISVLREVSRRPPRASDFRPKFLRFPNVNQHQGGGRSSVSAAPCRERFCAVFTLFGISWHYSNLSVTSVRLHQSYEQMLQVRMSNGGFATVRSLVRVFAVNLDRQLC